MITFDTQTSFGKAVVEAWLNSSKTDDRGYFSAWLSQFGGKSYPTKITFDNEDDVKALQARLGL
jgi:hypothetical protein